MARRRRMLAVAVATGRMGCVFLKGDELCDWRMSRNAARNPNVATEQMIRWIAELRPDVVVNEAVSKGSRKGVRTRAVIVAVSQVATDADVLDVSVLRQQDCQCKYEEAERLAERWPEIKAWMPNKPKIWESEPKSMIYFEALGLVARMLITNDQLSRDA